MKNILICFGLAFGLILLSCSENSLIDPNPDNQVDRIEDSEFLTTKIISGAVGGELSADHNFILPTGDTINVTAILQIDSLSFSGTQEIKMIPNYKDASIQFFPKMVFNKPIRLTLKFSGLNLNSLGYNQGSKPNFVYIYPDGTYGEIIYSSCAINWPKQELKVTNAKLNHFSRYSFIRS